MSSFQDLLAEDFLQCEEMDSPESLPDTPSWVWESPEPLPEAISQPLQELGRMMTQILILFPTDIQETLLTVDSNTSYMDVYFDTNRKNLALLNRAKFIGDCLKLLQGTGETMLVDQLARHQQAYYDAATKLAEDLDAYRLSLGHVGPDGLEERAWKMCLTD